MRRFASLSLLLIVPALAGLTLLSGCGGGEQKKDEPVVETKPKKKKGGAAKAEELEAPTNGILKGRVILDGDSPKIVPIDTMAKHQDSKTCMAGTEAEKSEQTWILGPNKGVANVVIKLVAPAGKKFKNQTPAKEIVEIDQPHCAYIPHVVALTPGQKLRVLNTSDTLHNTKVTVDPSSGSPDPNLSIPPGKKDMAPLELNPQRDPVTLGCQIHAWMQAKVYVSDHSYIAVTKDDGSFEIRNVPTGVELKVVGIHGGGEVDGGKEGKAITFKAGENQLDLKIKPR